VHKKNTCKTVRRIHSSKSVRRILVKNTKNTCISVRRIRVNLIKVRLAVLVNVNITP
jgi:hypothetical protein